MQSLELTGARNFIKKEGNSYQLELHIERIEMRCLTQQTHPFYVVLAIWMGPVQVE